MNSRDRYIEEEAHYREQPQIRTAQIKYEDARDTLERPPIFKKGASPTKPPKGGKYDKDANSSSDEDEIAIAQKWLNLRKQKIERINQELTENRMRNEAPTHDTHYTEEPRSAGHRLPRSEQSRRYEEEVRQSQETRAPRGLRGPKMQLNELNDEEIRGLQKDWRMGSPGFKSLRSDGFASAKKESNTILNDKDFFKKRAASSASKAFNVNPAMSPGVVNLNQMNVDDLIQLKKVLDEKINSEKSKNHFESSHGSTGKSSNKPQQLSFYSPTAQFSEQPTYVDTTKSASSAYFSGRMENDYDYQNRYAKAPQRMINEEPPQYERNERRVEYRDNSKHEIPIDTSVMRDFDSIAYTLPKADGYRVTEFSKEQYEPIPQENEESRAEEDSLEVDNTEKLYEEKLKEFLKVRERMLKANKIRDQGVQIESILKSTLRDSKMSNKSRENPLTISTQRQRHLNSPPSIQSLGRPDTAKLSEKDFMLSQELVKHGLQEGLNFMQNNRFARDEIPFEITKRLDSEAKTPDYGYGRSQASIKSSRHPDSEIGEEVEELTDDFYDDKLFDLVEDIEKTESATNIPGQQRKSNISATSRLRGSEVDNEFNSLFNTVNFKNKKCMKY